MRAGHVALSLLFVPLLAQACHDSHSTSGRTGAGGTLGTAGGSGGTGTPGTAGSSGGAGTFGTAGGTAGGGGIGQGGGGGAGTSACVGGASAAGTGGGEAGTGGGTAGGTAGTAATSIPAGMLYPCPDPPPNTGDVCPNDSVTCTYPGRKSCACYSKAWLCRDCPTSQPTATDNCSDKPFRISMSCNYGNTTCSCQRRSPDDQWHCGICPPVEPLTGDLCGNVPAGTCLYGADTCSCGAGGVWSCATATCPAEPTFLSSGTSSCTPRTKSAYTCRYPEQDQDCICLPDADGQLTYLCSCPANAPANGSRCINSNPGCVYGDVFCTCDGSWRCQSTTPPNPCPACQPSPGGACSVRISTCAYGSTICSCDGSSWSCF